MGHDDTTAQQDDPLAQVKEDVAELPKSEGGQWSMNPYSSWLKPMTFSFEPHKTDYAQRDAADSLLRQLKKKAKAEQWDGTYAMTTTLTDGRVVKVTLAIEHQEAPKNDHADD